MTYEELIKTHSDYDAYLPEWQFFIRSYHGGKKYRDGDYLLKHPFESDANYLRRKQIAYYYNYCQPITDIINSHLFRNQPARDFKALKENPLFKAFLWDTDREGTGFEQFIREAQRAAAIYGRVSIIIDKPAMTALTLAEAQEKGIYAYASLVTPENVLDWAYTRDITGRQVLSMIKIYEGENKYRIWTQTGWELWEVVDDEKGKKQASMTDSGLHNLGIVPVVTLYNRKSGTRQLGISDIQDIADINKNIYYLCSDAKEIIENTAFPMLALPYEKGGIESEKTTGPKNIMQFDPELPNSSPFWLEAPHSSLAEIREWIQQDIQEIHRIAKMGGSRVVEKGVQPWSGTALSVENQSLYAVLSEKADNVEEAEYLIYELWARWEVLKFDGVIDYPDDFSVDALAVDIQNALMILSAPMQSEIFKKELQKKLAVAVLPKLSEQTKEAINNEIDAAKPIEVKPANEALDKTRIEDGSGNNGGEGE